MSNNDDVSANTNDGDVSVKTKNSTGENRVIINNKILLGLIAFFVILLVAFLSVPDLKYNPNSEIFTGLFGSLAIALSCWYLIGSIEGGGFDILGIKINSASGGFLIFLICGSLWVWRLTNNDNKNAASATEKQLNVLAQLSDYSDFKLVYYGFSDNNEIFHLDNIKEISKYLDVTFTKVSNGLFQIALKIYIPENYITNIKQIRIDIDKTIVEETFTTAFNTQNYLNQQWSCKIPSSTEDYYQFQYILKSSDPVELKLK